MNVCRWMDYWKVIGKYFHWMHSWASEWMKERMNERTNERKTILYWKG